MKITLTALGCICAAGTSPEQICQRIQDGTVTLGRRRIGGREVPFGAVDLPETGRMRCYDLLDHVVAQLERPLTLLKQQYPAHRLGIVLGSSNTGIHEAQEHINQWMATGKCPADFSFDEIELGSPALYLKQKLGFEGPAYTLSTACSSSAKAFVSARHLLTHYLCDAVVVGGVDSRCDFALNGFHALEALSPEPCLPFSKNRQGINLGEGAALFIMERDKPGIYLIGAGERSDAYHLTHPDPDGKGAASSMRRAIHDAGIPFSQVDYINLHGTGTLANDSMEARAVYRLFEKNVLCASTKALTGHTLGAAGAIELALSWLMLRHHFIIGHRYDGQMDLKIPPICLAKGNEKKEIHTILSNSFAFGGSNVSLILKDNVDENTP